MISILVLYLTFGVFSNALIYPTNKTTHSGGFSVRSNQQNIEITPKCMPLLVKAKKGLDEKNKCKNTSQPLFRGFEYSFSSCDTHCCYLKDLKDRLESEINPNNECPKTEILDTIIDTNFYLITGKCESIGCKCFQKMVETFESKHKTVSDKNCPNDGCDEKTKCCSILEANEGFRDEIKNANECDSKVREEIVKSVDAIIYSVTNDSCPDCKYKVEKSNEYVVNVLCFYNLFVNKINIERQMSTKMKCGADCSDSVKCCRLFNIYDEIERQHKSKPIEICGEKQMNSFRTHWSESKEFLRKHCSHCLTENNIVSETSPLDNNVGSDKSTVDNNVGSDKSTVDNNVGSSVRSTIRWYHSIGLVSIPLTFIQKVFFKL